jgi:hypothetical protein
MRKVDLVEDANATDGRSAENRGTESRRGRPDIRDVRLTSSVVRAPPVPDEHFRLQVRIPWAARLRTESAVERATKIGRRRVSEGPRR